MNGLKVFVKKHYKNILLIGSTLILCPTLATYIGPNSDYIILFNILIVIAMLISFFNLIIKKKDKFFGIMALCSFATFVSTNHLYSNKQLNNYFPKLNRINQMSVITILFIVSVLLFAFIRFMKWLNSPDDTSDQFQDEPKENKPDSSNKTPELNHRTNKSKVDKLINALVMVIISVIVLSVVFFSLYIFITKKNVIDIVSNNFLENYVNFIVVVFIICLITIVLLLTFIDGIQIIIRSAKRIINRQNDRESLVPNTFLTSSVIFFVLLYFAYKRGFDASNYSLDNLLNISIGNKIALPVTLLLLLTVFVIFIHLIDYIIKSWNDNRKRISMEMKGIVRLMLGIVLGSIKSALKFIQFVPNYFSYMYDFVMLISDEDVDEEEECNEEENNEEQSPKNESNNEEEERNEEEENNEEQSPKNESNNGEEETN